MFIQTPIALEHIPLLSKACEIIKAPFSEHTAGNLFLYRKTHEYVLIEDEPFLFVRGVSYDKVPFLMPLCNDFEWIYLLQLTKEVNASMIYPIDVSLWALLEERGFRMQYDASDTDYMYERSTLQSLSGRMLAKKKNLYSQFTTIYKWKFLQLDACTLSDAHHILDTWYKDRPDSHDQEAMYDGLRFFDNLNLLGWVAYVDNAPVGVYYGEIQKPSTFVVHCSKALPNIKGLGAFLHIEATKNLPLSITHLNWEQDLGLEGLRHAKSTFQPSSLRKKGRAYLNVRDMI